MDADSAFTRVERTFWSVWYYITGAVNRFLRSEPTDSVNNDPSSIQESSVDTNAGHTEGSTLCGAADGDQILLPVSSLRSSSQLAVPWEVCAEITDSRPKKDSGQLKVTSTKKESEEGELEREEPLTLTQSGNDNTCTPCTKHAQTSEDGHKQDQDVKVNIHGQDETTANDETCPSVASMEIPADAIGENMMVIGDRGSAEEEAPDHDQDIETLTNFHVKDEDVKNQLESERDTSISTKTEVTEVSLPTDLSLGEADQRDMEELKVQSEIVESQEDGESIVSVLQFAHEPNATSGEVPGARQAESLLSVGEVIEEAKTEMYLEQTQSYSLSKTNSKDDGISLEQDQTTPATPEGFANFEADTQEEGEDKSAPDDEEEEFFTEEEAAGVFVEPANKQTGVVPQKDVDTFTIDSHSEDTATHAWGAGFSQDATEELTNDENMDVRNETEVQIATSEALDAGVNCQGIAVDEMSHVTREPPVAEEGLTSTESHMEKAYVTTAITASPEGEMEKEVNADLRDILLGVSEGRAVSQGLYASAYEVSKEPVPVCNNEPGPDEITTQWFLEVTDYKETQTAQLPEEVETKEPESFQNSGNSSGAEEGLLADGRMEDGQDLRCSSIVNRERILSPEADILSISAELPTETALVELIIEESGGVLLPDTAGLSDNFMKTAVEKESDAHDGWTEDKSHLHDVTEESSAQSEIDEGSFISKEAEASWTGAAEDVAEFTESNIISEKDSSSDSGLTEGSMEAGFQEEYVEADRGFTKRPTGETQATEEAEFERQEMAEDILCDEVPAEPIDEKEHDNVSVLESSSRTRAETPLTLLETIVQQSDVTANSADMITAAPEDSAATEFSHFPDETGSGGQQGPSDEEIFDLWMEAALSEEKSHSGKQQTDAQVDLTNEQEDEYPKDQQVGRQSEELRLDYFETSPSTAESGLLDQPLTDHLGCETQQLASTGTDSPFGKTERSTLIEVNQTDTGDQPLEIKVQSTSGSGSVSSDSGEQDESFEPEKGPLEFPDEVTELAEADWAELLDDQNEVDGGALDFAAQKSRIAVKNPRVRPPKDPRSLLHKPSVEPMHPVHQLSKVPAGVPLGGFGMGIKLPGLGAGFPALKKTPRGEKAEKDPENSSQELEAKAEGEEEKTEQDETPHKPRWTPPRHPGFGNPLMSELKTKLKKTAKE